MELTILMPCLNEAETIKTCINKAKTFLNNNNIDGEILIADNGSTDDSVNIALKAGARVINVKEKGYGSALINGYKSAQGEYVIMGDADDSYNFLDLMPFLEQLRNGADLVMGNRFKGGIDKGAMPFLHKYLGTPVLSFIGRLFYHNNIGDFNCGLRGFNRQRILDLNLHTTGMEFASEMIVKSSLYNYNIVEVPTTLKKDGRTRAPHLKSWSDGWRHLTFLIMHAPNWLFLYPGLILTILGVISTSSIIISPIIINGIRFDITTLLYCAISTIIGFQLLLFYILTKKYAYITNFIPITNTYTYLMKFTMNKGIFIGILLFLLGIIGSISAVVIWSKTGFGNLYPEQMFRLTIPMLIFLVCGIQLMFSSFFLGILEIKTQL